MAIETITIDGRVYTPEELAALLGLDALEPPYDSAELQRLVNEANSQNNALVQLLTAAVVLAVLKRDFIVKSL